MLHSQGPSSDELIQFLILIPIYLRLILIFSSHLSLGLSIGLFPVDLPVKILKPFLPSSILSTSHAYFSFYYFVSFRGYS